MKINNSRVVENENESPININHSNVNSTENDQILTPSQTALLFNVCRKTIHNWTVEGKIHLYGLGGRRYYKKNELLKCLTPLSFGKDEQ